MNDVIKVLQQVSDTCGVTKYCARCDMFNDDTGVCVFADMPYLWDFEKLEEVLSVLIAVREAPPAADVQPVKRGKWIWSNSPEFGNPYGSYICSECESSQAHRENFCPDCGAKMIKDGDTE